MEIKKQFNSLTPVQQIFTSVLFLIIVFVIISKVYYFILSLTNRNEVENEQKELVKDGLKLSYPKSQYKTMADTIYNAGFDTIGTDEQTIFNELMMLNNNLDYLELKKSFGLRRSEFSFIENSIEVYLRGELNESEINQANTILRLSNISYII